MATLQEDIDNSAAWIAKALVGSGYGADFSPQSLHEIDRFFDEHSKNGAATPRGLLAENLGQRIFAIGAYLGEVVRRELGGKWNGDDNDPQAEVTVEFQLPDGTRCWPVARTMKRFQNGPEDGLAAWGSGMGLLVGPTPVRLKRGFFQRLFR